jgi:hypothetical protein
MKRTPPPLDVALLAGRMAAVVDGMDALTGAAVDDCEAVVGAMLARAPLVFSETAALETAAFGYDDDAATVACVILDYMAGRLALPTLH